MISTSNEQVRLPAGYSIIRVERDDHYEQCADLWSLCFGLDNSFYKESELKFVKYHAAATYAVINEGRVCATLVVLDFEMRLNGNFVKCGGIANVATDPSQRRGNLVKALMQHALQKLHDDKVPVSALHAFSFPYYERMGYAVTTFSYKIKVPASWCRTIARAGDSRKYKMTALGDFDAAARVHESSLQRWNVTLRRPTSRWEVKMFEFGAKWRMFCHQDGYMLWDVREAQPKTLHIGEWNYLTQEALLDGLALLGTMDSQVEHVEWIDGDIRPLLNLGASHPAPEFSVYPKLMTRVVNLEAYEATVGKFDGAVCDPLNISAPAALDGSAAATNPGEIIQIMTGLRGIETGAVVFKAAAVSMPFGLNYCNDFF